VVVSAQILSLSTGDPLKLRLDIVDGSLLDVFISVSGRYAYHWERRLISRDDLYRHDNAPRLISRDDLYRHDNAPYGKWRHVATFPKHFHDGSESKVVESQISDDPEDAMREFLTFVRHKLLSMP
jgi:hypothetical protein